MMMNVREIVLFLKTLGTYPSTQLPRFYILRHLKLFHNLEAWVGFRKEIFRF